MKSRLKFTIYHGVAVSLALHSAMALPFVAHVLAPLPNDPEMLVVELQGIESDIQTDEVMQRETKGEEAKLAETETKQDKSDTRQNKPEAAQSATKAAASNDASVDRTPEGTRTAQPPTPAQSFEPPTPPTPAASRQIPPQPAERKSGNIGSNNISGAEEQQSAQTIKQDPAAIERINAYGKLLTKKLRDNLIYPDEAKQAGWRGITTVSFTILQNGQIRPDTMRVISSSGYSKLDASALKTIQSCIPFAPPPKEMTVTVPVDFAPKH